MSQVKGRVGEFEIEWEKAPAGKSGSGAVRVRPVAGGQATRVELSWRIDADGIRLEFPHGSYGFDLQGERGDDGRVSYQVSRRGASEAWTGASFLRAGEEILQTQSAGKKRGVRVRAQMPGKILKVIAKQGSKVAKDQPLALMEAMKMENEIRAPQAGLLAKVLIEGSQAVETGADLFVIEPESP